MKIRSMKRPLVARQIARAPKWPGQTFTRNLMRRAAIFRPKGKHSRRAMWQNWVLRFCDMQNPKLIDYVRASIGPAQQSPVIHPEWREVLDSVGKPFAGDFIEFLSSRTIFDSLDSGGMERLRPRRGKTGAAVANYWT